MDTNQITESLGKIYGKGEHRIVFWSDPDGEFESFIDELELTGVETIRLDDTGHLNTKLQIERKQPEDKFLLYSALDPPPFDEDVLLDIRIYSYTFRADRASMVLSELKLVNRHLVDFIAEHIKFFDNKERFSKLKQVVVATDLEEELSLKMLSIVAKSEHPELFSIVRTLFQAIATSVPFDLDEPPAEWGHVERFGLDDFFWTKVQSSFNYAEESPTLQKLLVALLLSELAQKLGESAPEGLCPINLSQNGINNAIVCLEVWRDSAKLANSYNRLAEVVAEKTNIDSYLDNLFPEHLANASTFLNVDRFILSGLVGRFDNISNLTTETLSFELIDSRQQGHWVSSQSIPEARRRARYSGYEALKVAFRFFALRNKYPNGFQCDTATQLYTLYVEELYEVDQLYRHFNFHASIAKAEGWEIFSDLKQQIENTYKNWFLTELSLVWSNFMGTGLIEHWSIEGINNQYGFYEQHVAKRHREKDNRRTFVIISDAFRYEAAKELTDRLNGTARQKATLETQLGVLPSYTTLGMASLLPHKSIEYTSSGDVLVDDQSTAGTDNRRKVLEKVEGTATQADYLLDLKKDAGRELIAGKKIIYIYHNEIDTRGDNAATEGDTFVATEDAIRELTSLVRYIINSLSGNHIIITADHGFLYTESSPDETDKSKLADKPAGTVKAKKRYLIGTNLPEYEDAWRGTTATTAGCTGDMDFWIPKGSNRFHFTGGARFIHGGAMPQEIVVPVITIKTEKTGAGLEATRTTNVGVTVLGLNAKITTASHRFTLIQSDKVTDRVKAVTIKVAIYDGNDVVSSSEQVILNSTSDSLDDRQQIISLTLKSQEFDKHKTYQLKLTDVATNVHVATHDVTIQRAISDDFDNF